MFSYSFEHVHQIDDFYSFSIKFDITKRLCANIRSSFSYIRKIVNLRVYLLVKNHNLTRLRKKIMYVTNNSNFHILKLCKLIQNQNLESNSLFEKIIKIELSYILELAGFNRIQ